MSVDRTIPFEPLCTLTTWAYLWFCSAAASSLLSTTSPTHIFCLYLNNLICFTHLSQNFSLASCIVYNLLTSCLPASNLVRGTCVVVLPSNKPPGHRSSASAIDQQTVVCCQLFGQSPIEVCTALCESISCLWSFSVLFFEFPDHLLSLPIEVLPSGAHQVPFYSFPFPHSGLHWSLRLPATWRLPPGAPLVKFYPWRCSPHTDETVPWNSMRPNKSTATDWNARQRPAWWSGGDLILCCGQIFHLSMHSVHFRLAASTSCLSPLSEFLFTICEVIYDGPIMAPSCRLFPCTSQDDELRHKTKDVFLCQHICHLRQASWTPQPWALSVLF